MAEQPQNGKETLPKMPEGELYLFVRLNPKTNEFSCLFSDLLGGLALIPLAQAHITNTMIQPAPQIPATPLAGFDPQLLGHFRKRPGGN